MTIAESEIIEKFRQLGPESRARVLAVLQAAVAREQAFNVEVWLQEIEKLWQLELEIRTRALAILQEIGAGEQAFSVEEWLQEIEKVQISLPSDASGRAPSASDLVNEVREERDADILRSLGFRDPAGDRTD